MQSDDDDGQGRGLRRFGLSRVRMRGQVHAGFLPGVTALTAPSW
ncbi:hypothetical protein [Streptomyces sp. NBC_01232]